MLKIRIYNQLRTQRKTHTKKEQSLLLQTKNLERIIEREFRAIKAIAKGQTPVTKPDIWEKVHSDDYELGKILFGTQGCVQCHAINKTGIGAKGPNLTLFGLRTSLAAGWMRNDEDSLDKWLRNSNDIKFGNLMWNGEGIDDRHPLRQLQDDDEKVSQLVTYLLGLK